MWLFTKVGFFSIVLKDEDAYGNLEEQTLTVRARVERDLDTLRTRYMPELGNTIQLKESDYPFRAMIKRQDFARGASKIAYEIDYRNFKHEVGVRQGKFRAKVYGKIWGILLMLEKLNPEW